MKKVLLTLILPLVFLISGCSSDPIQDDLLNYSNEEMKAAFELEDAALNAYDGITGANYSDDQTMYVTMVDEVIPNYNEFIKEIDNVKIETDELKEIHELLIKGADTQYNAFVKIISALENQDPDLIQEANGMLEEARKHMRDYRNEMEKLAKEHDVEFEE